MVTKDVPCKMMSPISQPLYTNVSQGSHHTWKTLNFVIFFSMPGICSKSGKNLEFNSKLGKNLQFANSMFQASLFKMSFTKIILIYFFCHIYIINTNTDSKPKCPCISLLLPGNNLENTWNFMSQEKWKPCICFNTFQDFYN